MTDLEKLVKEFSNSLASTLHIYKKFTFPAASLIVWADKRGIDLDEDFVKEFADKLYNISRKEPFSNRSDSSYSSRAVTWSLSETWNYSEPDQDEINYNESLLRTGIQKYHKLKADFQSKTDNPHLVLVEVIAEEPIPVDEDKFYLVATPPATVPGMWTSHSEIQLKGYIAKDVSEIEGLCERDIVYVHRIKYGQVFEDYLAHVFRKHGENVEEDSEDSSSEYKMFSYEDNPINKLRPDSSRKHLGWFFGSKETIPDDEDKFYLVVESGHVETAEPLDVAGASVKGYIAKDLVEIVDKIDYKENVFEHRMVDSGLVFTNASFGHSSPAECEEEAIGPGKF